MIQVGLLNLYRENPVFNILQGKVRVFDYLNKLLFSKKALFLLPGAFDFGLARTIAVPCAADDLDIFNTYSGEQIEFQEYKSQEPESLNSNLSFYPYTSGDNGVAHSHQNYGVSATGSFPQVHHEHHTIAAPTVQVSTVSHPQQYVHQGGVSVTPATVAAPALSMQPEHRIDVSHSAPIPTNVSHQEYQEPVHGFSSHFNLNMNHEDLINDQYFNDFKPTMDSRDSAEYQSLYGSSSESYVSPLDDEFFKRLSPDSLPTGGEEQLNSFDSNTASNKKRGFDQQGNFYEDNSLFNVYMMNNSRYNNVVYNENGNVRSQNIQVKQEVETFPNTTKLEQYHYHNSQQLQQNQELSQELHNHHSLSVVDRNESVSSTVSSLTSSMPFSLPSSKKIKLESDLSEAKYKCNHCDAKFKVKGYLTRHLKKHNSSKAFVCPFYHESPTNHCNPSKKNVVAGTKCHPTGGFSRRDTYKTHLKALHFIYPPGTKSNERNSIGGNCAGCFVYFENNIKWLEDHIEKGLCEKIEKR